MDLSRSAAAIPDSSPTPHPLYIHHCFHRPPPLPHPRKIAIQSLQLRTVHVPTTPRPLLLLSQLSSRKPPRQHSPGCIFLE